jgi:hypothetical protein
LQVGDTGPVESARRSNSRVLGSPFSGLSGQYKLNKFRHFGPKMSHKTTPAALKGTRHRKNYFQKV